MSLVLQSAPRRTPHERSLLTILRDGGPTSRTGLAEATGLSPTTISKVVGNLVSEGLVAESVVAARAVGRPAVTLTPVDEAVTVLGVQIGAGTVHLGVGDAGYGVTRTESLSFPVDAAPETVCDLVGAALESLVADHTGSPVVGVGVGVPGPVDPARRALAVSVHLGWRDVPIADVLEARLGLPVVVDHNVRTMALAESRHTYRRAGDVAYLYVRTGVGLGIAVRGQAFYGGSGGESYLGHTRVVDRGELCSCGSRGCLDTIVSEPAVRRALRAMGDATDPPRGEALSRVHELATTGNRDAVAYEDAYLDALAGSLSGVVNLFTPDLVLLGGILSTAPERLVTTLRERTRDRIFPLLRDDLRVEQADGSDTALVRGATASALEMLHFA
ncbi:ROK family transcriptional regulator [Phycicoccus sp. BSK3Z-2]|uniref:ROK family transcriptional regulator n=1 Tax=Phycicoccus avicenniae TaxID=2828860 RepID=A0A941D8Z3_9MICO|nr:ROK family transcriptional regulator [Phycicoccus avicenniae]MBR7742682.1 ROK family transcriptional regulator [Phycicoccus avicenniae]